MSNGSMKLSFEYFWKWLIGEQNRLIASSRLTIGKALMVHSKKNPHKGFIKNPKPHTKGPSHHSSNDAP